jgi:hypothetical protein
MSYFQEIGGGDYAKSRAGQWVKNYNLLHVPKKSGIS